MLEYLWQQLILQAEMSCLLICLEFELGLGFFFSSKGGGVAACTRFLKIIQPGRMQTAFSNKEA